MIEDIFANSNHLNDSALLKKSAECSPSYASYGEDPPWQKELQKKFQSFNEEGEEKKENGVPPIAPFPPGNTPAISFKPGL
jgi:hypothetical protein